MEIREAGVPVLPGASAVNIVFELLFLGSLCARLSLIASNRLTNVRENAAVPCLQRILFRNDFLLHLHLKVLSQRQQCAKKHAINIINDSGRYL